MQTRVIGERVYDYSHNVGGTISIMAFPVSLAFGSEDVVYVYTPLANECVDIRLCNTTSGIDFKL